jgi:hypothetical protein
VNDTVGGRSHAPRTGRLGIRGRAIVAVAVALAALVVVNGLVSENASSSAGGPFVGAPALPVVQMARPSAWRCPGPLPVGAGKEHSQVAVVNGTGSAVGATVTVSRTDLPVAGISDRSSLSRSRLEIDGGSQALIRLPASGPPGFAAVSVETDGGGIGVSESVSGLSGPAGPGLISSPCTLGSAPLGYIPAGSTYGSSDVRLALFDPDATPAVVNVAVSEGRAIDSPPPFQGVVVPANGLVVLDLRRWVFQVGSLAVSATAVSGDIVVGALDTTATLVITSSGPTSSRHVSRLHYTGVSLLVGPDRALKRWSFTALQSRTGVGSMFSVYNPGSRSVPVSVAPPGPSGAVAALSEDVPAEGIVEFETPVTPGARLAARSVVVSAGGAGSVVVARITTREAGPSLVELNATSGTAGPSRRWLLPGATVTAGSDDVVTVADPGSEDASVRLIELPDLPAVPVRFRPVTVYAGSQRSIDLGPLMKKAPAFALEVLSSAPVLVEGQLHPRHGLTDATGAIPLTGG